MVPVLMVPRYLTDASLSNPRLVCYPAHDEPAYAIIFSDGCPVLFQHTSAREHHHTTFPLHSSKRPTPFPAPHFSRVPAASHYHRSTTFLPHTSRITPPSQHHISPAYQPHHTTISAPHFSRIPAASHYHRSTTFLLHFNRITLPSQPRFSLFKPLGVRHYLNSVRCYALCTLKRTLRPPWHLPGRSVCVPCRTGAAQIVAA